jgi:hypothetical protein
MTSEALETIRIKSSTEVGSTGVPAKVVLKEALNESPNVIAFTG